MGLVQEENLLVFFICLPREAVRQRTKKWRTQEDLALSQPWVTACMEEGTQSKRPLVSQEARPATRAKIPCLWRATCKRSSCDYRHPPVTHSYKSGNGCIYGHGCQYRHADGEKEPSKRSNKKSTQGAVAVLRQNKVQGCVSQNSDPKKSVLRKAGEVRLNASAGHTTKFSGRTWYEIRIRDRQGPSRGVIQEGEPRNEHLRMPQDKKIVTAKQRGIWREKYTSRK